MVSRTDSTRSDASPARLEILGIFGAGKTTLANMLTASGFVTLPERHEQNPFWGNPAKNEKNGYLQYEVAFLLQHLNLIAEATLKHPNDTWVCDWSFLSDRLWASMRLGQDIAAYEAIYLRTIKNISPPLAYMYIRRSPELLLKRLHKRRRAEETSFYKHIVNASARLDDLVKALPTESLFTIESDLTSLDAKNLALKIRGKLNAES